MGSNIKFAWKDHANQASFILADDIFCVNALLKIHALLLTSTALSFPAQSLATDPVSNVSFRPNLTQLGCSNSPGHKSADPIQWRKRHTAKPKAWPSHSTPPQYDTTMSPHSHTLQPCLINFKTIHHPSPREDPTKFWTDLWHIESAIARGCQVLT